MSILALKFNILVNIHDKGLNFTHSNWKVSTAECKKKKKKVNNLRAQMTICRNYFFLACISYLSPQQAI